MSTNPRLTDADYAELAADYAANPITADEVIGVVSVNPAHLRMGRPAKGAERKGNTKALPVRFPDPIRNELYHRVEIGESDSAAELVRVAVAEYFENHPAKA